MKKLVLILTLIMIVGVFTVQAQDDTARIRFAHLSYDAAELDLLVDGELVSAARFGTITHYLEAGAGTHQLAVVPTGSGVDAAVLGPADVNLEAGHNYTLAAIGQQADMSFSPLIIDETLTLQTAGITSDSPMLLLNAVSGAPAMDVYADGNPVTAQLSFGGYVAAESPAGSFQLSASQAGQSEMVVFEQTGVGLPNNTMFVAVAGVADDFTVFSANASSLNAVEFLTGLSGTPYSVDTLLNAVNTAGMTDALSNQGPFTLFAPLDTAFAAVPADTLNGLMADPSGLTNVLGYHIIGDYVSSANIVAGLVENGSVDLTAAQGGSLALSNSDGTVLLNGSAQLVGVDYYVRNGVIHFIDSVLMP
jgi:uncharacterized surface protein with fasciclin (FAS1) repeats